MTEQELAQFIAEAEAYWRQHPDQRRGQAYCNYLSIVRPYLRDRIQNTIFDPFYVDDRLDEFLRQISALPE